MSIRLAMTHAARAVPPSLRFFRLAVLLAAAVILCLGGATRAAPATSGYKIGPTPAWVVSVPVDASASTPVARVSNGVYYLLVDQQVHINDRDRWVYKRFAKKALNDKGIDAVSHIEIEFDPSYQNLTLHTVKVLRGGQTSSRLEDADVKVLQRERELEYRIYDGSKSANIFLKDVRAGDVVEYSYTVAGANPVFGNRQFGWLDLQWHTPVHRLHRRLLVPAHRKLQFARHGTDVEPRMEEKNGYRSFVWDAHDVPGLVEESGTPDWFDPQPFVEWGEFPDWATVARWAEPLYRIPTELAPALRAEVDRIARTHGSSDESRLLGVLKFVQEEIRYLGVEIGPGSHAPRPAHQVLANRYGDCKDKSLLAVTMLRALNVQASPALVHTRLVRTVKDSLPSPGAFNHVIVRARLNGRDYWLDPTRSPQKGSLSRLYQPDYGYALALDGTSAELVPMRTDSGAQGKRSVHLVLDSAAGQDQPATYTVTTAYDGVAADSMRNDLAAANHADLQRQYLNYYARSYPGITVRAPLSIDDNEAENRITVTEHYAVSGFWNRNETLKRVEAMLRTPEVASRLQKPKEPVRQSPLAVNHPEEFLLTLDVVLPRDWKITPATSEIKDPAFTFSRTISYADRRFSMAYRYLSHTDHVNASAVPAYVANLDRARALVGYSLFTNDPPVKSTNHWSLWVRAAFMLAMALLAIRLTWRIASRFLNGRKRSGT